MKRLLSVVCALILLTALPLSVFAKESQNNQTVIYYEDGSRLIITTTETGSRSSTVKTGQRTYTYTSSSGDVNWEAVLSAAFTYDGTTSTCIASSCQLSIIDTDWYEVSKVASKSGNTARTDLTMGRKVLGVTVSKTDYVLTLSCDKNGNLS